MMYDTALKFPKEVAIYCEWEMQESEWTTLDELFLNPAKKEN